MELHEKIRMLRQGKKWTQKDMSDKLGLSSIAGYQKIENGKTALTIDRLKQIAKIFEVDFFELLGANGGNSDCSELERENQMLKYRNAELSKIVDNLYADKKNYNIFSVNSYLSLYRVAYEMFRDAKIIYEMSFHLDNDIATKAYHKAISEVLTDSNNLDWYKEKSFKEYIKRRFNHHEKYLPIHDETATTLMEIQEETRKERKYDNVYNARTGKFGNPFNESSTGTAE